MRRALVLLALVVVVLMGLGVYVAVNRYGQLPIEIPVGKGCSATTANGSVNLYPEQMANAATITAVGVTRGIPDRGVVVALATAMQESELVNLPGGDRDSVGLFQQRPSQGWGTVDEVHNPHYAASAFYNQLERTPGWQEMRVTEAAQAVQRSAYPEAYEKWADEAQVLADALIGHAATAITCTLVGEPALRGEAASQALAHGLRVDWGLGVATPAANDAQNTVTVAADHDQGGWQIAHWLVAHSNNLGVSRVRYAEHEWTVQSGRWSQVAAPAADAVAHVLAEVHPA